MCHIDDMFKGEELLEFSDSSPIPVVVLVTAPHGKSFACMHLYVYWQKGFSVVQSY